MLKLNKNIFFYENSYTESALKYLLILLLPFLLSCRTTRVAGFREAGKSADDAAASAGDAALEAAAESDMGGLEEEDFEEEFADSEEFEKQVAKDASDSDANEASEDLEQEFADSSQPGKETALLDTDDTAPADSGAVDSSASADMGTASPGKSSPDDTVVSDTDSSAGGLSVIKNIRYSAGENKIYIEGEGALSYQSRENTAENQIVIEIPNAILADSLKWPFIMKDFDTNMAFLKADQKDNNVVRVVIQMRGNAGFPSVAVAESGMALVVGGTALAGGASGADGAYGTGGGGESQDMSAYAEPTGIKDTVLPAKTLEDFFLKPPEYTGRPISIHLKDVDIRDVLYFISEGTGLNMVISEGVSGKISLKLRKVPWDQALLIVLKTRKLGYVREGNVIRIMTLATLKQNHQELKEMIASQKILEPLQVKVIPVVYAEADQLEPQAKIFLTKDRGKTLVDKNTNSIILTDTKQVIKQVESLIKHLDRSPTQVMIEAKIVEARKSFVRNLGIGWLFTGEPLNFNPGGNSRLALNLTGGIDAFPTLRSATGGGRTVKTRNLAISFAPVGRLEAVLDLSEANNSAHVISSPRIMVLNGEEATITQSTETIDISTQQAANTGVGVGTSAQRNPVVLQLKVKPKITSLGSVFMRIEMKRDFPGAIVDAGTRARPVNTRSASTKVLVSNGQTIVIGGIYQADETRFDEGLPILKNIPLLSWLFNTFNSDRAKNELLLFLTPRVMTIKSAGAASTTISQTM